MSLKRLFVVLVLGLSLATPSLALANTAGDRDAACEGVEVASGKQGVGCGSDTAVLDVVGDVISIAALIAGIIALIFIFINAFRLVAAQGDSGSISKARTGLIYAVIGLVVALMAQALVFFVIDGLSDATPVALILAQQEPFP